MTGRRLLIDASAGFNQGAGIGRYTREILRHSLPGLAETFDLTLWYASDSGAHPPHKADALAAIPADLRRAIKRSAWSRSMIDRLERFSIQIPQSIIAGRSDLAYSPDFTLPGERGNGSMVTVHDLAFEIIPEAYSPGLLHFLQAVVPKNIRRAERIAVVSRTTRIDVVERYNIPSDRVVVIPNAADSRFFEAKPIPPERRAELGLPDDFLLAVGTIEPRKNYATLLQAQAQAFGATKRPLVVVGRSGWQNDAEMRLMGELKRTGAVIPILNASDADLPGLYAGAATLIYIPLYEGFGLPVLEAMAAGTPVITSDIPTVREVASGKATIVPARDVGLVAEAIRAVGVSQPLASTDELQSAARAYDWATSGGILIETLRQMGTL
jgi:glycosyltransferase involved in cell wall biosynthesis